MTDIAQIQASFEAHLPRINTVLRYRLRRLHGEEKDEAEAEATALAWDNYRKLALAGRDPTPLVGKIAEFAAKSVLCGGRLAGQDRVGDVLSPVAQHQRGVITQPLNSHDNDDVKGILGGVPGREPDPAQQAILNADVSEWLETLTPDERNAAVQYSAGWTNQDVGDAKGYTRGWSAKVRKRLKESCPMLR